MKKARLVKRANQPGSGIAAIAKEGSHNSHHGYRENAKPSALMVYRPMRHEQSAATGHGGPN